MSANPPKVMVSSTFYDLRQIRSDLAQFIEGDLGYVPLLSELPSFPVDPDVQTIENCRRRVERDADILVLVIGGRYGSVDSASTKSVTNLEYLAARAKGIPVYAFAEKTVLANLQTWKSNPTADFSHVVNDARIFGFVEQVRSQDAVWSYEFETAQDIVRTLRVQLSYLMREGLQWRLRARDPGSQKILEQLRGRALRLALEKPTAWEYRLFAQAVADQVDLAGDTRREHRLALAVGPREFVPEWQFPEWASTRFAELQSLCSAFAKLFNETAQEAFGPPGKPGDPESIMFVAKQIGAVYREAIAWSKRVQLTISEKRFEAVMREMAEFTNDIIAKIESFGPSLLRQIDDVLLLPEEKRPKTIRVELAIELSNLERFERALAQATTA